MATFEQAIEWVLPHEGKEVTRDPVLTKWGVTLPELIEAGIDINGDGVVDERDIYALTREDARDFYETADWRESFEAIADQRVATKLLDLVINGGERQAIVMLQRACRAVTGYALKEDGSFGPKTLAAVNGSDPGRLLAAYASEVAGFYRLIAALKPERYREYLTGWLERAYDTPRRGQ